MDFPIFNLFKPKPQATDMQVSALRDALDTEMVLAQEVSDLAHLAGSEHWVSMRKWLDTERTRHYQTLSKVVRSRDYDFAYGASLGGQIALIDNMIENVEAAPERLRLTNERIMSLNQQIQEIKG